LALARTKILAACLSLQTNVFFIFFQKQEILSSDFEDVLQEETSWEGDKFEFLILQHELLEHLYLYTG